MTTTFPAQTYTIPQHNNQMTFYNSNGLISPPSSSSPASPRTHDTHMPYNLNPTKQLRPPKQPLYVPAVLRQTEHFATMSPLTPPKSTRGSVENLEERDNTTFSPEDLESYFRQAQMEEEELGEVTGPPKQDHWKPDEASTSCDLPQCKSNFNLFVRKHHCRYCGHIFCSTHSKHTIPLDQAAEFHPEGFESRACETCHRQYQKWDTARSMKRKNSGDSSDSKSYKSTARTLPVIPGHRRMQSAAISAGGRQQQHGQISSSLANSVPKDWAWSTF